MFHGLYSSRLLGLNQNRQKNTIGTSTKLSWYVFITYISYLRDFAVVLIHVYLSIPLQALEDCNALHFCWTIRPSPLHRQKLILASAANLGFCAPVDPLSV